MLSWRLAIQHLDIAAPLRHNPVADNVNLDVPTAANGCPSVIRQRCDKVQTNVEQTLTQLANAFTARDIMVDVDEMARADDPGEAARLLEAHSEYDQIPLPAHGRVGGYYARNDNKFHAVQRSDLISDGTSLLTLPELLADRTFFFVLTSNHIQGFIHFSDLNNGLVRLPLFALFEAIERHFTRLVVAEHPDQDTLGSVLTEKRVTELRDKVAKATKHRSNRSALDYLSFDEVLRLCDHFHLIPLKGEDRQTLSKVRNLVVHPYHPLIEEHRDVRDLVRVHTVAKRLLALG